jgi:hypothetical protein
MRLPPYFLSRPPLDLSAATHAAFAGFYREVILAADGGMVDYAFTAAKWRFLCWLCDTQDVLLHGSGNSDIRVFEPRKSNDVDAFGDRRAVYAASDGIWPLFFAIVDRDRSVVLAV